jgi:hypothetical protein
LSSWLGVWLASAYIPLQEDFAGTLSRRIENFAAVQSRLATRAPVDHATV